MVLYPNLSHIYVHIEQIDIFKFYVGKASNFSVTYPDFISPYFDAYHFRHCLAFVFLDLVSKSPIKSPCYEKYSILFNEPRATLNSKWANISQQGCTWNEDYIDCGCEWTRKHDELRSRGEQACKMNGLKVKYDMATSKSYYVSGHEGQVTKLILKPKSIDTVTTTQTHAMNMIDLLSQIGGFLGLLVGASIVTLFEFFEFAVGCFIERIKLSANKVSIRFNQ